MSNRTPRNKRTSETKRKNRAALLARLPLLESLERREMMAVLTTSEKAGLKEAFQALTGFTTNLEQSELLNTNIPILNRKIGEVVDVDQLVRQQFLTPIEKFLDTAQPTSEDLQKLFQSGLSGISRVALGKMPTLPTLVPNVSFAASFDIDLTKSFQFDYDLGAQLKDAGVDVQIGKVSTNLDFELHFGAKIDINAINRAGNGEGDEAREAEFEISQAVAAIGRATQQDSQAGQVWSDLNWLWQEQDHIYGPKKGRAR